MTLLNIDDYYEKQTPPPFLLAVEVYQKDFMSPLTTELIKPNLREIYANSQALSAA